MATFVETAWDNEGNPTDGYYEDDNGEDYSHEGITAPLIGEGEDESAAETKRLMEMNAGERGQYDSPSELSFLEQIARKFGVVRNDGSYDISRVMALLGTGAGIIGAATAQPQTLKSISELRAGIPSNAPAGWTPEELAYGTRPMQTGSALQRVYAADMPPPIAQGRTNRQYADGGEVVGPLSQAFAGGIRGQDGGQSDLISINVSPGEYVMDAESVSALGDGNTEAGIAKLDELRRQLRTQKRSASIDSIPEPSAGPLTYMSNEV